jgi:hypothetical protein
MRTQQVAAFLLGIGGGLAIAWIVEAVFVGRGVVSTYLGPVACSRCSPACLFDVVRADVRARYRWRYAGGDFRDEVLARLAHFTGALFPIIPCAECASGLARRDYDERVVAEACVKVVEFLRGHARLGEVVEVVINDLAARADRSCWADCRTQLRRRASHGKRRHKVIVDRFGMAQFVETIGKVKSDYRFTSCAVEAQQREPTQVVVAGTE